MKLLLRSLLVCSLLFLGRYEYLYAFAAPQGTVISVKPAHPDKEQRERLKAVELTEEDDDDKLGSFRHLISGDIIPSFHYAPSPGYTTVNTKSASYLYRNALYSSPRKYILFGVFRI